MEPERQGGGVVWTIVRFDGEGSRKLCSRYRSGNLERFRPLFDYRPGDVAVFLGSLILFDGRSHHEYCMNFDVDDVAFCNGFS